MRTEKKQQKRIEVNGIQSYHNSVWSESYATIGFEGGFFIFNSDRKIKADGTAKSYGVEIELTSTINSDAALGIILEKVVFPTFPSGLFKQQRDGSLGGNSSSEVITQPMTKAFIRNHYNDFKAMWLFLKDINTAPDDTCGMHVNVSLPCFGKTREAQNKAIMLLNNWICDNYHTACELFKRSAACTTFCRYTFRDQIRTENDHHYAINYSHINSGEAARVELRLVGPQKTFAAFRNTMETVFWLVEAAKDGKDFSNPVKLFSGCNECVIDRLRDIVGHGYINVDQFEEIKSKSVNMGIQAATR